MHKLTNVVGSSVVQFPTWSFAEFAAAVIVLAIVVFLIVAIRWSRKLDLEQAKLRDRLVFQGVTAYVYQHEEDENAETRILLCVWKDPEGTEYVSDLALRQTPSGEQESLTARYLQDNPSLILSRDQLKAPGNVEDEEEWQIFLPYSY